MADYQRVLGSIYKDLQHLGVKDSGFLLDESKMFEGLKPFFFDYDLLRRLVEHRTHIWEYAVFVSVKDDSGLSSAFEEIIKIYRAAECDREVFKAISRHHFFNIRAALENAHDAFHLERYKRSFLDRVNVKSAFQDLDLLLEGSVFPLLRVLACLSDSKVTEYDKHSFGQIVACLSDNKNLESILSPEPWGVRISQWRNISSHKNYNLDAAKQEIVCLYGKQREKTVSIHCDEMRVFLNAINKVFHVIKSATMFAEINCAWATQDLLAEVSVSLETVSDAFAQFIISNGIVITKFEFDGPVWKLVGVDLQYRGDSEVTRILDGAASFTVTLGVVIDYRIQITPFGHVFKGRMSTDPNLL